MQKRLLFKIDYMSAKYFSEEERAVGEVGEGAARVKLAQSLVHLLQLYSSKR